MTFKLYSRVRENSTTTGTGPFTVTGAVSGHKSFSSRLSVGDTTFGSIVNGTEWVVALLTYSGANQLTVTTVFESSNADAAVTFSAGTKDIFIDLPGFNGLSDSAKAALRSNADLAPALALAAVNMANNPAMDVSQELGTTGATLASAVRKYIIDQFDGFYVHGAGTAVLTGAQLPAASFPTALSGYANAFQLKATTAMAVLANNDFAVQRTFFEGTEIARLGFGAAGAQSLSYAFWYYSTASGVMFTMVQNHNSTRNYCTEHTVAAGWNYLTAIVPGDTSGTWVTTASIGMIFWVVAAGKMASPVAPGAWGATQALQTTNSTNLLVTNNNQVIMTGLVIVPGSEVPSQARAQLMMRPFSQELARCERWYEKSYDYSVALGTASANGGLNITALASNTIANNQDLPNVSFKQRKRNSTSTITIFGFAGGSGKISNSTGTDLAANSGVAVTFGETGFCPRNTSGGSVTTTGNVALFHWVANDRM